MTMRETYETRASIFNRLKSSGGRDGEMAWTEFQSRYAPVIAGFAKRCGANNQDVDDIVQDVMTAFFSVSDGFKYDPAKGRFRGWLKTCTVRAAVRRAGKNLHFRGMRLDEVPQVELAVEPLWSDIWEQQIVARALSELRRECAESVAFRAFEQYVLLDRPADIVAKELNTSVDNVHQAKSRMTKRLRDLVGHIREDDA
jgi:RNA polymerase sigma factor (sigma-70 family)